jgi:hypothetical protein
MLQGLKFCSVLRTREQSFIYAFHVYTMRIIIWLGYVRCSILYKENGLRLIVYMYYSWEMDLTIGLDVSFDRTQYWKGMLDELGVISNKMAWIMGDGTSCWIPKGRWAGILKYLNMSVVLVLPRFSKLRLKENMGDFPSTHVITAAYPNGFANFGQNWLQMPFVLVYFECETRFTR